MEVSAKEKKNIYALIVGINKYKSPGNDLDGCLRDVQKVEEYLKGLAEDRQVHIEKLLDDQATYANIISQFRNHLCKADKDDVVFFHFSGHGSEEPAAEEFVTLNLEPNGKNQTLVCHDSSVDAYHLADKELAVLLHEVATQFPDKKEKEGTPHIVVSLDCCHSGSGTRDFGEDSTIKTRAAVFHNQETRPLSSYLDGYYSTSYKKTKSLSIPMSKHVLLSACESREKACDSPHGGVFTRSLLKTLGRKKGNVSYADLFTRTRATAKREAQQYKKIQTPQFEPLGNFNPNSLFLDGTATKSSTYYELQQEKDAWYVKCGAINGVPGDASAPIEVIIRDQKDQEVARASIASVGAQLSRLQFESDDLDLNIGLLCEVLFMTEKRIIWLHGKHEAGVKTFLKQWEDGKASLVSKNLQLVTEKNDEEPPELEVEVTEKACIIRNPESGRELHRESSETGAVDHNYLAKKTIQSLDIICRWKQTLALENPNSKISNMFDFEVEHFEYSDGPISKGNIEGSEIKIYANKNNADVTDEGLAIGFKPKIKINKSSARQDLYFYLFWLDEDFSVQAHVGETPYHAADATAEDIVIPFIKDTDDNIFQWGVKEAEGETSWYLKLIVTTERLDYHELIQEGLNDNTRGMVKKKPDNLSDEWDVRTIKITMVYQKDEVGDKDLKLNESLLIRKHKNVRAKVNLVAAEVNTRSTDPAHRLAMFQSGHMRMMNLGEGRSHESENVMELVYEQTADLSQDPLQIEIPGSADDMSMVLPIAFDGQDFVVIGDSAKEGDKTVVNIRKLPEVGMGKDRSLFKALKMAFFTVALKKDKDEVNQLRWVEYKDDGSIERHKDGVDERIAGASNILVLLHGIIGDTEGIAAGMGAAQDENGSSFKDKFDLVLTYDYENLNAEISKTANLLKTRLQEAKLGPDDGKKLTMLAHSMGGLVSRWFIEQQDGKEMVDHLILLGTPNAGSKFGTIESYRQFATATLNIAVNFISDLIPFAGRAFQILQGVENVTVTLGQMTPGSEFLKELNVGRKAPGIPYTILAGDITNYDVDGGGFKGLLEKSVVGLGDMVYSNEANDIAVSLESIFAVEEAQKIELVGHHLNYFNSPESLKLIGSLKV